VGEQAFCAARHARQHDFAAGWRMCSAFHWRPFHLHTFLAGVEALAMAEITAAV
jgi:hypothetical protein